MNINRIILVKLLKRMRYASNIYYQSMFEFKGTGKRDSYAISFECHKSLAGCLDNNIEVNIYNISPDAYNELYAHYSQYRVEVYIGYEDKGLSLLFEGFILRVWNAREGMDDKITLSVYQYIDRAIPEGGGKYTSRNIEVVWDKKALVPFLPMGVVEYRSSTLKELIVDLGNTYKKASGLSNLVVDTSNINPPLETNNKKRTFSGSFYGIMDTLAVEYGFTWTIDDDVLRVFEDSKLAGPNGTPPILIGQDTLISCEPILQGQFFMNQIGMKIVSILDSAVKPASIVQVQSKVYPKFNGQYFVHEADYTGSSYGSDWKMTLESKTRRL